MAAASSFLSSAFAALLRCRLPLNKSREATQPVECGGLPTFRRVSYPKVEAADGQYRRGVPAHRSRGGPQPVEWQSGAVLLAALLVSVLVLVLVLVLVVVEPVRGASGFEHDLFFSPVLCGRHKLSQIFYFRVSSPGMFHMMLPHVINLLCLVIRCVVMLVGRYSYVFLVVFDANDNLHNAPFRKCSRALIIRKRRFRVRKHRGCSSCFRDTLRDFALSRQSFRSDLSCMRRDVVRSGLCGSKRAALNFQRLQRCLRQHNCFVWILRRDVCYETFMFGDAHGDCLGCIKCDEAFHHASVVVLNPAMVRVGRPVDAPWFVCCIGAPKTRGYELPSPRTMRDTPNSADVDVLTHDNQEIASSSSGSIPNLSASCVPSTLGSGNVRSHGLQVGDFVRIVKDDNRVEATGVCGTVVELWPGGGSSILQIVGMIGGMISMICKFVSDRLLMAEYFPEPKDLSPDVTQFVVMSAMRLPIRVGIATLKWIIVFIGLHQASRSWKH